MVHKTILITLPLLLSAVLLPGGAFGQSRGLTSINLSNKGLTAIPDSVFLHTELKTLDFSSNRLVTLPPKIGELKQLEKLILYKNQLTSLPPEIGQLINLKELNVANNQLTRLPRQIRRLSNLKRLYLMSNQLSSLPPQIGQLLSLKELVSSDNKLASLPSEIGQLVNLTHLYLNSNLLIAVPPEVGQLVNLVGMELDRNKLTSLPPEIGKLIKIKRLDLSYNQLTALPAEMGQMVELVFLALDHNQLTSLLPSEFKQLRNLRSISLEGAFKGHSLETSGSDVMIDQTQSDHSPPRPGFWNAPKTASQMPRFPGYEEPDLSENDKIKCANDKLSAFIKSNLIYPPLAQEYKIEGIVIVDFIVETDLRLSSIHLAFDNQIDCAEEALRIVNLMNKQGIKWIPGKQNNTPQRVLYSLAIPFELGE